MKRMNSTARKTKTDMAARGFRDGMIAGLTGRVRRSEQPKVMSAAEIQYRAWNRVGRQIRHSMDSLARMEMTAMSGPLPPSHEFASYEKTLPGAADRILRMAEEAQKADIKADQDMRDAYREDRRAENWVFKFTSAIFSTVTIAAFACSIVFVALKLDSAAYLSFACTFASLIPRIVESFRGGGRSK